MLFMYAGVCHAVVRNGSIEGKAGLSYGFMSYDFGSVNVTIMNGNRHQVTFGGTMVFLDKDYRVVARAGIPSGVIKRNSSRRYKGFFTEGSGSSAQKAKYVRWEF